MKLYLKKYKTGVLFILLYLIAAFFFCYKNAPFFPSMDAPAHFHNSFLLKEYISGNETVREHFQLTGFYVPNIFSGYVLGFLYVFLPFKAAAYIFIFSYYFLIQFFTRYLLAAYSVKFSWFYAFAITFLCNSLLLHLGFFNFSWSAAFLCLSIGFYKQYFTPNQAVWYRYAGLFCVFALLYYTNALALLFFITYCGMVEMSVLIRDFKARLKHTGLILLFMSPFLLMLYYFYTLSPMSNSGEINNFSEYFKNLKDISSAIIYNVPEESEYTRPVFYILCSWLFICIAVRFFRKEIRRSGDELLLLSIISLVLYFIVPDGMSVGMFSPRLQYFFFYFLILWLLIQSLAVLKLVFTCAIIIVTHNKHVNKHRQTLKSLNSSAASIKYLGNFIEANSSVYSVNLSDNWLMPHFSNFVGTSKPMIILENYEAAVGWFPLKWNYENIHTYTLGGNTLLEGKKKAIAPDYILAYGNLNKLTENHPLKDAVIQDYTLIKKTDDGFAAVFKLKNQKAGH